MQAQSQTTVQFHKHPPISAMGAGIPREVGTGPLLSKSAQLTITNILVHAAAVERFPAPSPEAATPPSKRQLYPLEEVAQSL